MEIKYLKTDELIPYDKNAKRHPDDQIKKIAKSIREFGWTMPILIDRDNVIIAGHGRLMAACELGLNKVPVIFADEMPEDKIKAYRIADNKLAESFWDRSLLAEELRELSFLDFDLSIMGFDNDEIAKLLPDYTINPGNTDPDHLPEDNIDIKVQGGDIYKLGHHRLVCGDCCQNDIVDKLMGGGKLIWFFRTHHMVLIMNLKMNFLKKQVNALL